MVLLTINKKSNHIRLELVSGKKGLLPVNQKAQIIMIAVLKHLEDGQQLDYGGTCLVPMLLYQEVMILLLLPMQSIMREIRWRSHCCLMCKIGLVMWCRLIDYVIIRAMYLSVA